MNPSVSPPPVSVDPSTSVFSLTPPVPSPSSLLSVFLRHSLHGLYDFHTATWSLITRSLIVKFHFLFVSFCLIFFHSFLLDNIISPPNSFALHPMAFWHPPLLHSVTSCMFLSPSHFPIRFRHFALFTSSSSLSPFSNSSLSAAIVAAALQSLTLLPSVNSVAFTVNPHFCKHLPGLLRALWLSALSRPSGPSPPPVYMDPIWKEDALLVYHHISFFRMSFSFLRLPLVY